MRSLPLMIVAGLGMTSVAWAQDFEAAGKHFSAAQEAFGAKHYRTAAAEFEAAYGITKDPVLLYNVAESYEKAGDGRKAAANYKAYLKDQPAAADKAEVQKRIRGIEANKYKLADQSAPGDTPPSTVTAPPQPQPLPPPTQPVAQPPSTMPPPLREPPPVESTAPSPSTPPPPPQPSERPLPMTESAPPPATTAPPPAAETPPPGLLDEGPSSKLRVAAWIGVASTLAVLTAGAIFGLAAQSRSDEINRRLSFVGTDGQPHKFDANANNDLHSLRDDGVLYNKLAIAFYTIAAASTVATVTLFVVDAKRPHPAKHAWRIAPVVGKNGGGLVLGGSF